MERRLRYLLEEHKRSKGPMSRELITLAQRTNGRGLPNEMKASIKWIIAWGSNELPSLTPEEFMVSDPDIMPPLHYCERVSMLYPDGNEAMKFVTRTGAHAISANGTTMPFSAILSDDLQRVRPVGYARSMNWNGITYKYNYDWPSMQESCLSANMLEFLDMIISRKVHDGSYAKKCIPDGYWTNRLVRMKMEKYKDDRGAFQCGRHDDKRKLSKKTLKKKRKMAKRGAQIDPNNYKSYSYVPIDPRDNNSGNFDVTSKIYIVDKLSHPMYRNLNDEQRNMMISWAKAQ